MVGSKTRFLIAGTAVVALGTGYVMQYGLALPGNAGSPPIASAGLQVTGIADTSSAAVTPRVDVPAQTVPESVVAAAATTSETPAPVAEANDAPAIPETAVQDCSVSLSAEPAPAAQVALSLKAPCFPNERLTLHHNGLMLTESTDDEGMLSLTMPAFAEDAVFIVSFANGEGAVTQTKVPGLAAYDRVAVQWKGDLGVDLHAREFGADYYSEGHVWKEATGSEADTIAGHGGFLQVLGDTDAPEPLLAQVYTFPTAATVLGGTVSLSVEAQVTKANCGREIEAQSLQLRHSGWVSVQDISLSVPDCDATGDFVLLRGLLEDVIVAKR